MNDIVLVPRRSLSLGLLLVLAFGLACGFVLGDRSGHAQGVQEATKTLAQAAYSQALVQVQGEMQKACTTWFNDTRSKKPVGRLIVCRAPAFMNLTTKVQ